MLLPCFVMADVIAIMFILADVIANYVMADVIVIVLLLVDVIANYVMWDIVPHLYCVCGRCYNHFVHG